MQYFCLGVRHNACAYASSVNFIHEYYEPTHETRITLMHMHEVAQVSKINDSSVYTQSGQFIAHSMKNNVTHLSQVD